MKPRNAAWLIAASIGLILLAAGCSSVGDDDGSGRDGAASAVREQGGAVPGAEPATEGSGAVSAEDDTANGAASPADQFAGLLDRKIVRDTSIDLKVEEVGRNFQDIIRIAELNQGIVASSSFSTLDDEQVADLTVRVPSDRYQAVLQEIRGLGEVVTEGSESSDVTEEYTDLDARLRTLEASEQRYLELLSQAGNVNDILTVQDRLDVVRGQIEQVQGRINLLDNLTELSTITVHVRPLAAATGGSGGPNPGEAAQAAWAASFDALRGVATVVVVVAAFSWWLVPVLVALAFGVRRYVGRHPKAVTAPTG